MCVPNIDQLTDIEIIAAALSLVQIHRAVPVRVGVQRVGATRHMPGWLQVIAGWNPISAVTAAVGQFAPLGGIARVQAVTARAWCWR
jgi:hypothetical protein